MTTSKPKPKAMSKAEAAKIMERFNAWRRGRARVCPKDVGHAIDLAVAVLREGAKR